MRADAVGSLSFEDRFEIADLQNRYAFALDSRDWELLRTVFSDDAEVEFFGATARHQGIDAVVAFFERITGHPTATLHDGHNYIVWSTGTDTAEGRVHYTSHYIAPSTALPASEESDYRVYGTYEDRYVRVADGWRISYRRPTTLTSAGDSSIPHR